MKESDSISKAIRFGAKIGFLVGITIALLQCPPIAIIFFMVTMAITATVNAVFSVQVNLILMMGIVLFLFSVVFMATLHRMQKKLQI